VVQLLSEIVRKLFFFFFLLLFSFLRFHDGAIFGFISVISGDLCDCLYCGVELPTKFYYFSSTKKMMFF